MGEILPPAARFVRQLGTKRLSVLVLLLTALLLGGFCLGRYTAHEGVLSIPDALVSARSRLSKSRETLDVALAEVQRLRTQHEVDSRALEMLRVEIAAGKERIADLEEGLSFYRSMVGSEGAGDGLRLLKPELVQGGSPERFSYRFFVQQLAREYRMVEGQLSVDVIGDQGEEEVSFPLAELSDGFSDGGAALHFRYFQAIEGELTLPDGFVPRGVVVVVRTSKPRETEERADYPWELQERFIHVGR
jgi:hypothetical protein